MTFKETEYPEILKQLNNFAKEKFPINEIVKQTYRLYQKVPIYPGIVSTCVANILQNVKPESLKVGDVVIIEMNKSFYEGQVNKIKKSYIELKNVKVLQYKKSARLRLKNNKIKKVTKDTLAALWPSLNFEKEK